MTVSENQKIRVLITDDMDPIASELLRSDPNFYVHQDNELKTPELLKTLNEGHYDALVVRSRELDAEFMQNAPRGLFVLRGGTGINNFNLGAAANNAILVANTPKGNVASTATLTITLMGSLARRIPYVNAGVHSGVWDKKSAKNDEVLDGKILGIIGCGRIGFDVAKRAMGGFNMEVIAYDPYLTQEQKSEREAHNITFVENQDDLFYNSDVITVHANLLHPDLKNREDMRHIVSASNVINAENIAKCKTGAHIVNCSRGQMVDPAALRDGLDSNILAGAALDVLRKEPSKDDPEGWKINNPLLGAKKLILTPHIGGTTVQSLRLCAEECVRELKMHFIQREISENIVNLKMFQECGWTMFGTHAKIFALRPPENMMVIGDRVAAERK